RRLRAELPVKKRRPRALIAGGATAELGFRHDAAALQKRGVERREPAVYRLERDREATFAVSLGEQTMLELCETVMQRCELLTAIGLVVVERAPRFGLDLGELGDRQIETEWIAQPSVLERHPGLRVRELLEKLVQQGDQRGGVA